MNSYSQMGQDLFVIGLTKKNNNLYFLDVGCWLPDNINNTFLLEQNGWDGLSIDITNLSNEWKSRKTKFINLDALVVDYEKFFNDNNSPMIIDYLSLDIEGDGLRCKTLKKIFESNREFKIITIEHDDYRGYTETEKKPQREFLNEKGYYLLCSDVSIKGGSIEDWWINPKYFNKEEYEHLISSYLNYDEILNKII